MSSYSSRYDSLKIGNLEAKVPIIQGGMGVGISLGNLAGAVALEGGVGIISTAQIGFREPDFETNPVECNLRAIRLEYEKARAIAPDGVIGFNIMVALQHYDEYVRAAAKAGADIIISGAGLPTDLPKYVEGTDAKIAPIVSSVKSAQVILKYWEKKYNRTADLVVIEGPKAGGHLGFTKEQVEFYLKDDREVQDGAGKAAECGEGMAAMPDEKQAVTRDKGESERCAGKQEVICNQNPAAAPGGMSATYEEEIQKIREVTDSYAARFGVEIPVVVAGGIDTAEEMKRIMDMGVQGVQVATRFITTVECDASDAYKEAFIRAGKEDIQIVKSPVGMPGRAIRNDFMDKVMSGEKFPPEKCLCCLKKCNPAEIPYCITDALIHAAKGELERALLFCGANGYKADHLETVKEVMNSLNP